MEIDKGNLEDEGYSYSKKILEIHKMGINECWRKEEAL